MNATNEFSFVLRPSSHGIGVFALHDIAQDTHLRLFGDKEMVGVSSVARLKKTVPEAFQSYCLARGDTLICPPDFGHMPVGWYLNHSKVPNAYPDKDFKWYASRDIVAGEEILIDYNALEEPESTKEIYYSL